MNIYYTIDEKYLKALEKLDYGRMPKAKLLLEEILEEEPAYGKAHFHLACIYYDHLAEYSLAIRHMDLALKFAPEFPDVYHKYLSISNDLGIPAVLLKVAEKALTVKGVCHSCVYRELGLSYEKQRLWTKALENYQEAYLHATVEYDLNRSKQWIERVKEKMNTCKKVCYVLA